MHSRMKQLATTMNKLGSENLAIAAYTSQWLEWLETIEQINELQELADSIRASLPAGALEEFQYTLELALNETNLLKQKATAAPPENDNLYQEDLGELDELPET